MTSSIRGIFTTLRFLGATSLGRQLGWIATYSFFAGIALSGILVILGEFAVNSVQGKTTLVIQGHSLSIFDAILLSAALLFLYLLSGIAASFSVSSATSSSMASVRRNLMNAFFRTAWRLPSQERLGHLQQLLTFNCEKVADITLGMATGLQNLLTLTALLLAALLVNPVAAVVVIFFGVSLSFALRPFNKRGRKAASHLSESSSVMATLVTEYTRLAREFRLFGVQAEATTELLQSNEKAANTYRQVRLIQQLFTVVYQTLALGFIVCAFAVIAGHTEHSLSSIAAVLLLMLRSLSYGSGVQSHVQLVRTYGGFLDNIKQELIRFSKSPNESQRSEPPASFEVSVSNVSFTYDGRHRVLTDLSFEVPEGQILGIVGRSGSGKTTVSHILLGMLAPDEGIALVGQTPAGNIATGNGSSPLALVTQDPVLLEGSIFYNVAFFRDLSVDTVLSASEAAHLHQDVLSMPDQYETKVGEGGGALSGGQRQRLAIARALAGAPRLLVLDEPTSAVDSRSESLIRQTLTELRGKVTIIVISHRLALIENCDLLLVLKDGRMADFGPRADVVTRDSFNDVASAVARKVTD